MPAILILGLILTLIAIGFIRFTKEKNQEKIRESSAGDPTPTQESSYQTTQEADQSYYQETYAPEEIKENPEAEEDPKPAKVIKKTTSNKKTQIKKEESKKAPAKKSPAKKTPAKKTPTKKSEK